MCAQFSLEPGPTDLMKLFNAIFPEGAAFHGSVRILPHQPAPILTSEQKRHVLQLMKFSLVPSWSKEPKVKFATHNARLSTHDERLQKDVMIFEKPTWRGAFQARPCLVPMNAFYEAAYSGPLAGNMVQFKPKDKPILMAAGLWESWTDKNSGEVVLSFAIITDNPSEEIEYYGHDRSPVFVDERAWEEWLTPKPNASARDKVKFLLENKAQLSFEATSDRPLKAGWEKRKASSGKAGGRPAPYG